MSEDPWKHRSKGMRCSTCMWCVLKEVNTTQVQNVGAGEVSIRVGRCRRHSPSMTGYPVVYENDWCGDHKVDEEKV